MEVDSAEVFELIRVMDQIVCNLSLSSDEEIKKELETRFPINEYLDKASAWNIIKNPKFSCKQYQEHAAAREAHQALHDDMVACKFRQLASNKNLPVQKVSGQLLSCDIHVYQQVVGDQDQAMKSTDFSADEKGLCQWKKGPNDTSKFDKKGYTKHHERISNGTRLFGKYYRALWD
jgi:hypothetical protein